MANMYEALGPWAEADPIPLRGLSPRIKDLNGKTIGLLANAKTAAQPILAVVEEKLRARYSGLKTTRWVGSYSAVANNLGREQDEVSPNFREFVNGVDAVVAAVGD